MYSTKRKFHNLLNSLTNSTAPVKSASGQNVNGVERIPEAKRRRTTHSYAALLSTGNRSKTNHSIQMSKRDERNIQSTGEQARVSNYTPWDRGHFLQRLKTFRHVDRWCAKPAKINEVQWAKRGWTCVEKERVGCVGGCGKEVYVKLEEEGNETTSEKEEGMASLVVGSDDELIQRYAEMIVMEHDNDCPWRKRGCDDTIHRLALQHPPTAIAALGSRYTSLVAMESELPSNIVCPDGVNLDNVIETLPEDFPGSSESVSNDSSKEDISRHVNKDALALALLGWEAEPGHIQGLVTCNACFRRLGLWLFRKSQPSALTEADGMQDEGSVMASLDVVNEHREYCPWINATSQNSDQPGWEILVKGLRTAHHFRSWTTPGAAISTPRVQQQDTAEQGDPNEQANTPLEEGDETSLRDQKDKERFAKLRKLKRVFDVKGTRKGKEKETRRKLFT